MKIKVVSSHAERADELARHIRESAPGLDVSIAAHAGAGMPGIVNGTRPGLIVYDDMDLDGLDQVARTTQSHPDIDTIIDALIGAFMYRRLLSHAPLDDAFVARLLHTMLPTV